MRRRYNNMDGNKLDTIFEESSTSSGKSVDENDMDTSPPLVVVENESLSDRIQRSDDLEACILQDIDNFMNSPLIKSIEECHKHQLSDRKLSPSPSSLPSSTPSTSLSSTCVSSVSLSLSSPSSSPLRSLSTISTTPTPKGIQAKWSSHTQEKSAHVHNNVLGALNVVDGYSNVQNSDLSAPGKGLSPNSSKIPFSESHSQCNSSNSIDVKDTNRCLTSPSSVSSSSIITNNSATASCISDNNHGRISGTNRSMVSCREKCTQVETPLKVERRKARLFDGQEIDLDDLLLIKGVQKPNLDDKPRDSLLSDDGLIFPTIADDDLVIVEEDEDDEYVENDNEVPLQGTGNEPSAGSSPT